MRNPKFYLNSRLSGLVTRICYASMHKQSGPVAQRLEQGSHNPMLPLGNEQLLRHKREDECSKKEGKRTCSRQLGVNAGSRSRSGPRVIGPLAEKDLLERMIRTPSLWPRT
jgi:hypothetical protein